MPEQKIALTGGMYQARSALASAQRCVNLYPEKNAPEAPYPFTYYPTPGLTELIAGTGATHRCAYVASNGQFFEVIGPTVYYTAPGWVRAPLGNIQAGTTTVSMSDNGLVILVVDGSANGYGIDLTTHVFAAVAGQAGAFYGADRVDFVDTFFVLNRPGTSEFYCSLSNVTLANLQGVISPGATAAAFDPDDIAAKTGNPDPINAVIVMHREVWLIGAETSEVWYDAGGAAFPFAELPGVFIEHGSGAVYSVCKQDLSIYWLSEDRQGNRMVFSGNQYAAKRVSTHALEQQLQSYPTVSDAVFASYQQLGHTFVVCTFPTADATWVYDVAEDLWHERDWIDANGMSHRIRANTIAAPYGVVAAGDWETGELYQLDLGNYTDAGSPIVRRRGFPLEEMDGRRVEWSRLIVSMDGGETTNGGANPEVSLRFSDDRGRTWGNPLVGSFGQEGQFDNSVLFTQLGLSRYRVFEVFWSSDAFTALGGGDAWYVPCET